MKKKEIIKRITDAAPARTHRDNLSDMIVCWLKNNPEVTAERKESVYLTFWTLNEALKEI